MSVGEDIYSELIGDATLSALVGTRAYPNWLPQGATLPAISYMQVAETPLNTTGGELALRNYQYQFDLWADSYATVRSMADALRSLMDAATVFKAERVTQQDLYEPEVDIHRITVDFTIWQ